METESGAIVKSKPLTRFGEFELLKAIAIIGLPTVHVMEEAMEAGYASPGLIRFSDAIIGLCAFGPSVFMICMGFGLGGNRTAPQAIRRNGIQFLAIGALLNIFRWLIPGILSAAVLHTRLIDDVDFCLQSDIYYFVGIFFIFYSFLKQLNIHTAGLVMLSVIMLTLNTLLTPLTGRYITHEIASAIAGNFVYVNESSCFPLLSWAIFPSVGILLGDVLKKRDEEYRHIFMRLTLVFSLVLFASFMVFLWDYRIDTIKALVSPANRYITDLPNVVLLLSLALLLIAIMYFVCMRIGSSGFMAFMLRISAYIIPFYLLQWIIIAWIFYLLPMFHAPKESFGLGMYVVTVLAITFFCVYVSSRYGMKIMKTLLRITSFKRRRKKK